MYIDSNGNVHACPLRQTKSGNCIDQLIKNTIFKYKRKGALPVKTFKWVCTIHKNRIPKSYFKIIFPMQNIGNHTFNIVYFAPFSLYFSE